MQVEQLFQTKHDPPAAQLRALGSEAVSTSIDSKPPSNFSLSRKSSCACGGGCPSCQGTTDSRSHTDQAADKARHGFSGTPQPLPHQSTIQHAFGKHDISGLRAHSDEAAREACDSLGAHAFTVGSQIAFSRTIDLHTAAHEAAHAVQQSYGLHPAHGVSSPGDRFERHADAVANAVVRGVSAAPMLDSLGSMSSASAGRSSVMRQTEPTPNPAEYEFVNIEKGGTWDAVAILDKISQRELTDTRIIDPQPVRRYREVVGGPVIEDRQSDDYRCGPNAVLAAAISQGPIAVRSLCLKLYKRIIEWRDKSEAERKAIEKRHQERKEGSEAPELPKTLPAPSASQTAATKVLNIWWSLDMGIKYGSHAGGGNILTYADLDRLVGYLYTYTFDDSLAWRKDPAVPKIRKLFRTESEIGDAAKMAGYEDDPDVHIQKTEIHDRSNLNAALGTIPPGDTMIGMWGPHTYTFIRLEDKTLYLYDSWTTPAMHPEFSAGYEIRIARGLTGDDQPIVLLKKLRYSYWYR